ncbi:DeoR family transcriptional regulator [Azospirillum sp. TSO22-1]|nr:DeoR/GlpR family DNA-binding transcription regulator [Azospirillum sp. TSO22-1]PWC44903.1 DeoR family transcriptional regulator [Azospirillum sp. TSO22-1]
MDPMTPRQSEILALARASGRVLVDDLAQHFAVTPQTIRKDLNGLCERRLLQRVHGGAIAGSGVENLGYEARRQIAHDEKRRIGERAASLIADGSSLFINIGTTTEEVARALQGRSDLVVITNNINVANRLRPEPHIEVIVAGGVVRRADGGIVGEATTDFFNQFKVDYAIVGASAIDEDGDLLDYDYREVRVSQAIIANARHVILVADRSKLERTAPVRIGHISQVHTFVTDTLPSDRLAAVCREAGVRVEEVMPGEALGDADAPEA